MALYFALRFSVWSLGRNKRSGVDCAPDLRVDGGRSTGELGESGNWVIDITVRVLQAVEGRTLVFVQRNAILDAQWQVGLVSKKCQGSIDHGSMDEHSR